MHLKIYFYKLFDGVKNKIMRCLKIKKFLIKVKLIYEIIRTIDMASVFFTNMFLLCNVDHHIDVNITE